MTPNLIAGVGAGQTPEFIGMMQVGVSRGSGSTLGALGGLRA
jgi:hypothetical protein